MVVPGESTVGRLDDLGIGPRADLQHLVEVSLLAAIPPVLAHAFLPIAPHVATPWRHYPYGATSTSWPSLSPLRISA